MYMLRSELSLKEVKSVENCGEDKNVKILVGGGERLRIPFVAYVRLIFKLPSVNSSTKKKIRKNDD